METAPPDAHAERFRRTLSTTLVALVVLVAAFVGLTWFQGPKLSSGTIDTAEVISQPDQQLRLFANQPVAQVDAKQVTVEPSAEFTVSTENDVIVVQFSQPLDYGTDYTVTVDDVTSVYQDRGVTFRYEFTTDAADLYYLDRADPAKGADQNDAVIRTGVTGSARDVVYEARHIQDFVVVGDLIAVVTLNDDKTSAMTLISLIDGAAERLVLPAGIVDQLASAGSQGFLGFTLTSSVADPFPHSVMTLYYIDLAGSHTAQPMLGLDGNPLVVLDWLFLPDSTTAVAQTADESLLLIDPTGATPATPLGQYTNLVSVSLDGSELVVGDIFGSLALSLGDGSEERLEPSPVAGMFGFVDDIQLLGVERTRVEQIAIFDDESGRFTSAVVYDDGAVARVLYESPDQKGSIERFSVSPNGQYLAVTMVPDVTASESDGYFVRPMSTSVTTVITDIDSGAVVRSFDGFAVSW